MEHGYDKGTIVKRLHRIEGQVRGIERMVEDDRYCIDVLTQISAIQAALDKVALGLVDEHARHCVIAGPEAEKGDRTDELVGAIASGDPNAAAGKTRELLEAVNRFARTR